MASALPWSHGDGNHLPHWTLSASYIMSSDAETKNVKRIKPRLCWYTCHHSGAANGGCTWQIHDTKISHTDLPASFNTAVDGGEESERVRDYWQISWALRKGFLNCMLSFIIIVLHLCGVDTLQRSIDKGAHKKPCPLCSTTDKCRKNALNLNTSFGLAAFPFPPFHLSFWVQIHYNANYFMCFNAPYIVAVCVSLTGFSII